MSKPNSSKPKRKENKENKETKESPFTIVIDTREQLPYTFPKGVKTIRKGLSTGDYSILGFEKYISIERKSKQDFYGSVSSGRTRFKKCIQRLAQYRCPLVVIECSFEELLEPLSYSDMNPSSVANTLISWQLDYRIPFACISGRRNASLYVLRTLEKFWKKREAIVNGGVLNEMAKPFLPKNKTTKKGNE